ncbi:MAG: glycosyltransferase family 4 protein [Chloroflexi bacterium]|nr:glycosyltransferase family 4 protein [Chloroflexota bacterium]
MVKVAHIATIDLALQHLLLNQLKSIQQAGYLVSGISAPGPAVSILGAAGVNFIPIPFVRASNLTPIADLRAFWQLYRIMRRERFTIVHTHTAKADLYGTMAARLARAPVVVTTLHGFYFHDNMPAHWRRFYVTLAKTGMRFADVVLSQNPEDLETARRENVCPPEKMKFLGNGIDVRRFDRSRLGEEMREQKRAELGLPAGVPVVGFVGRLVADKGIRELFQAAQVIRQQIPGVRFLFVGMIDYDKEDAITPETAGEYGIADISVFTGMRHDMPELYSLMDVFVLPSYREAFPRSVMEASAMSVPAVVTNVRGCRTAVEQGRNGLIVPLGDVPALAEAILYLLNHPEEAARMGQEGRSIALKRFDEQIVFEIVKAEYHRLLQEKGLAAPQRSAVAQMSV